jgi:hypothetical protein
MPAFVFVFLGLLFAIVVAVPMPRGLRITAGVLVALMAAYLVYIYEVPGVSN